MVGLLEVDVHFLVTLHRSVYGHAGVVVCCVHECVCADMLMTRKDVKSQHLPFVEAKNKVHYVRRKLRSTYSSTFLYNARHTIIHGKGKVVDLRTYRVEKLQSLRCVYTKNST